ncbi:MULTISPECIES: hypothetical protein [unclassified Polynucleobacter]|uniref:hypothetical protein n=1 Tax=unclassified Polynucleobacter TaxID=2640945 RepID=UPI000BC6C3A4|nr:MULTISPECIES: hypothetical protein [unclassified Polynucleobacter]OYY20764.1 MAG: hypothetical protein B7Y67_04340 [Polynucleobacter sp. 35-46-11]OZA78433.1 MAG: hypothetical protein B7X71_01025 [Polynucleobacter sp. 39-46-10]
MKALSLALVLAVSIAMVACATPPSEFGVYRQSDGTVGVHAPKSAKDTEAQAAAAEECKKLGKRGATIVETRKTVNDRFPMTYIFVCTAY